MNYEETNEMVTGNIYPALLRIQRKLEAVPKDSTNPHFGNKYADLPSILDIVLPALNAEGLLLIHRPLGVHDGCVELETRIVHAETGEILPTITMVPLGKTDPQGFGSTLTYARRYATAAILSLRIEDDDGEAARKPEARPEPRRESAPRERQAPSGDAVTIRGVFPPEQSPKTGKYGPWKVTFSDGSRASTFDDKLGEACRRLRDEKAMVAVTVEQPANPKFDARLIAVQPVQGASEWTEDDRKEFIRQAHKLSFRIEKEDYQEALAGFGISNAEDITTKRKAIEFLDLLQKLAPAKE